MLIHDAITYATEPSDVRAALYTAAVHCRPGGTVAILPDFIREHFVPGTDHGGHESIAETGIPAQSVVDSFGREIFLGFRV